MLPTDGAKVQHLGVPAVSLCQVVIESDKAVTGTAIATATVGWSLRS